MMGLSAAQMWWKAREPRTDACFVARGRGLLDAFTRRDEFSRKSGEAAELPFLSISFLLPVQMRPSTLSVQSISHRQPLGHRSPTSVLQRQKVRLS